MALRFRRNYLHLRRGHPLKCLETVEERLEGSVSLEEYQKAKEKLINEKKTLQGSLKDFADGGDNWFEQVKDFVTTLNRIDCVVREGNLESQKEFLEKIGSNFILKERHLIFSTEGTFRPFLQNAPYPNWRRR